MAGKTPPRPQQSKRARNAAKKSLPAPKSVPVRAHERNLAPKFEKQQPRSRTLAERFRGSR